MTHEVGPMELFDSAEIERKIIAWRGQYPAFDTLMDGPGGLERKLRYFGLTRWADRHLEISVEAFRAALSITPDDARLWTDLGGALNAATRNAEAVLCIERALALEPGQATAWLLLGTLCSDQGETAPAEAAYRRAIALEPALANAHFGLGILYFNLRRFADSAASLRLAVEHGNADANSLVCLGQVLYLTADFAGCAEAFARAAALRDLDPSSRRKFARSRMMLMLMQQLSVEQALDVCAAIAGPDAEDRRELTRDAFSLLSAHGHLEAAAAVGRYRLAEVPDDVVQLYLMDAVCGTPLRQAPTAYIEKVFDRFAKGFDKQLVETLRYRVPQDLSALVAERRSRFDAILDLGCGTGLAAQHIKDFGGRLIGIDLSVGMLEEARQRGGYDALIKAEALGFLRSHAEAFDLVFAADVLIYMGDLEPVFAAIAAALHPGGLCAFSLEVSTGPDIELRPSGRFAHTKSYVEAIVAPAFEVLDFADRVIRLEANREVEGFLVVLQRRECRTLELQPHFA